MAPLLAFAPWREIGFLIHAAVLAKAQRRKGREGKTTAMALLNSQRTLVCLSHYWLFESGRRFKVGLPGVSDCCSVGFVDDPDCCGEVCCGGLPVWSPPCESSRRLRTGRFGVSESRLSSPVVVCGRRLSVGRTDPSGHVQGVAPLVARMRDFT